jgi:chaperonin cofactor prefoldin
MSSNTEIVIVRTELAELKRQLAFRQTMLERRKARLKEQMSADEWKIKELQAKIAEHETQEAGK